MAKVSLSANIVAKSSAHPPMPPAQIVDAAQRELDTLRAWLAKDPQTPYAREAGYRLALLAKALIRGGK